MRVFYNLISIRRESPYTRTESAVDILSRVVLVLGVLFMACAGAKGSTYTFTPVPADLNDLDHGYYYTWGIDRSWAANDNVVSATLSFSQIYNWDSNPNVLYIHLLDNANRGVKSRTDKKSGDDFNGQGPMLVTYTNLSNQAQNLSYSFTGDQLESLSTFAANGRFGLGFDPDCHFFNNGVMLTVTTGITPVPEPQTLALLALGSIGWIRRLTQHTKVRLGWAG